MSSSRRRALGEGTGRVPPIVKASLVVGLSVLPLPGHGRGGKKGREIGGRRDGGGRWASSSGQPRRRGGRCGCGGSGGTGKPPGGQIHFACALGLGHRGGRGRVGPPGPTHQRGGRGQAGDGSRPNRPWPSSAGGSERGVAPARRVSPRRTAAVVGSGAPSRVGQSRQGGRAARNQRAEVPKAAMNGLNRDLRERGAGAITPTGAGGLEGGGGGTSEDAGARQDERAAPSLDRPATPQDRLRLPRPLR